VTKGYNRKYNQDIEDELAKHTPSHLSPTVRNAIRTHLLIEMGLIKGGRHSRKKDYPASVPREVSS